MTLLPLVLSTAGWDPSGSADGRQLSSGGAPGSCRFCGFRAPGWMEPSRHHGQPVTACLLCSLCHGLDRPTIDAEARLIWLPEMSQAALIATVRRFHVICQLHNVSPTMDRVPGLDGDRLRRAWGVQSALLRRSAVAEKRLGSARIGDLAAALEGVTPTAIVRASLLGGLRLLPLGRFYRDGIDVYPAALAGLRTPKGAAA